MEFEKRVGDRTTKHIHILQLNVGKRCNRACTHCHVMASAARNEMMGREVFDLAMAVYDRFSFDTIDITGGEPTVHPDIEYFLDQAVKKGGRVILRTNLFGLAERVDLLDKLAADKVDIVASMPCYTRENVDAMRGGGTFDQVIGSIAQLNRLGYGKTRRLDLIYNPLGAFLPGPQHELEADYRRELGRQGLEFSDLLTITNLPLGSFRRNLEETGELSRYEDLLQQSFNPATLKSLMCRFQLSVSHDGQIFDCDFNQMEGIVCKSYPTLKDVLLRRDLEREIQFPDHCYGCTAGAGSSCGGALTT